MSKLTGSFGAFGVVLVSSIIAGLVLLQNDLQACVNPVSNVTLGGCTIHWQLIGAAVMTALISGIVHYLSTALGEHDTQIASLQNATGTVPAAPATAVPLAPAPRLETVIAPGVEPVPAAPVVTSQVQTPLKESQP